MQSIDKAVEILRQGGLVAIPTETVYGLGADASNEVALRKIFSAKQRPIDHPLIVHIADFSQLQDWAVEISDSASSLAQAFWPGPLTLILKKAPNVSDLVTGNQATIGIRVPRHPVALAVLKAFGGGIAAPSANRFGRISPTTAAAVHEELGGAVDLILDGGPCEFGVESTIVDVTGDNPVILRPGMITANQIKVVLKKPVMTKQQNAPRVSGALESHYAPMTKTILIESAEDFLPKISALQLPMALLSQKSLVITNPKIQFVQMSNNAKNYAHDLYQILRDLDKKQLQQIVIESVPHEAEWDAIRDRLQRASQ
ncbi:MAG: L-threonylcarbamoyladenylate synthase [Gammaproteobacteria bacterium]